MVETWPWCLSERALARMVHKIRATARLPARPRLRTRSVAAGPRLRLRVKQQNPYVRAAHAGFSSFRATIGSWLEPVQLTRTPCGC